MYFRILKEKITAGLYVTTTTLFSCHVSKQKEFKQSLVIDDRTFHTNVKVVYTDELTEYFEALRITEKGLIIGRLIQNEQEKM